MKRGQSGMVLQHTATDVLVKLGMKRELTKHVPKKFWARKAGVDISCSNLRKYDDGKTEWTEIEDLKKMDACQSNKQPLRLTSIQYCRHISASLIPCERRKNG